MYIKESVTPFGTTEPFSDIHVKVGVLELLTISGHSVKRTRPIRICTFLVFRFIESLRRRSTESLKTHTTLWITLTQTAEITDLEICDG